MEPGTPESRTPESRTPEPGTPEPVRSEPGTPETVRPLPELLGNGSMALVSRAWLKDSFVGRGVVLVRRQDLPPDATVSKEDAIEKVSERGGAVAISHASGIARSGSRSFDCAASPPSGAAHANVNPMEASGLVAPWPNFREVGCWSAVQWTSP